MNASPCLLDATRVFARAMTVTAWVAFCSSLVAMPPAHAQEVASVGPCRDWAARLPNLSRSLCEAAGLDRAAAGRSVQGRPIYWRDVVSPDASIRVLVVAATHGDELSSTSVAMHWLALSRQAPAGMPHPVHWRFIPALNPDGLLQRPARRQNANGVDLNRNFPTPSWAKEAPLYWERRTGRDPRRYPGPRALSEPESQFLVEQMDSFKPHLIVSIHAPFGVLDFDGPSVPPSRLGRLYLDQVGIYPGSLGNYAGVHKGVPVVTVELPNALRTPRDDETAQMWLDLQRWVAERIVPAGSTFSR